MTLTTERLVIRRFNKDDWQALHAMLSDDALVRYEPYGAFSERESRREAKLRAKNKAFWAVCEAGSGYVIGNVTLAPRTYDAYELGYIFAWPYHGRGYATEASLAVLRYGFEAMRARRVYAQCNTKNEPSMRVMQRLGMRREAHYIKDVYFRLTAQGKPAWQDSYMYAMLREEWIEKSSALPLR